MGPYNDYFMKFYEAAKYYYYPGWHEPGGGIELCMNSSWWGSLSDWERAVITACCMEEHAAQYEEAQANNGAYLAKLVDEQGVELKQFGEDIYEGVAGAVAEVFEGVRDHSPLGKKINDNFQATLREVGAWQAKAEVGYSALRNQVLGIG